MPVGLIQQSEIFALFRVQSHVASEQVEAEDNDLVVFSEMIEALRFFLYNKRRDGSPTIVCLKQLLVVFNVRAVSRCLAF